MINDSLKVGELVALLQKLSPQSRILVCSNSLQKNTSFDDGQEVIELVEHRIYAYEEDTATPEVIFHFEIPDWEALGVKVISQNGIFVETVYK